MIADAWRSLFDDVPGAVVLAGPPREVALDRVDPAPPPDGVTIEQVGPLGLRHAVEPLRDAFGLDDRTARAIASTIARSDADLMSWVAYAGDEPIGCATVLVAEGVAGVFNVGVVGAHRGRGIEAALTARALETARERGLDRAVLH